jgi:thiosulfate/3-mercaptopyruvate sulfurtransferase
MSDPLVTTAWLAEHLDDAGVQVIDASWRMPTEPRTGRQDYDEGHIPGAVFFDVDAISDHATDLPHMLPSPGAFADAAGALGLRREAYIVVYDSQGVFSAPRVWWTLRVMGFPQVSVLDGGMKLWRAEGRAVQTTTVSPAPTRLPSRHDADLVRHLAEVEGALKDGSVQVVDARPAARFLGEAPEPRPGLRSGHMPGARNLPWQAVVRENGTLKSAAEIRAAFTDAGVDPDRPIVTTCGSGITASVLALALARLGRLDVAVYDGSWAEWGGRADVPVATEV